MVHGKRPGDLNWETKYLLINGSSLDNLPIVHFLKIDYCLYFHHLVVWKINVDFQDLQVIKLNKCFCSFILRSLVCLASPHCLHHLAMEEGRQIHLTLLNWLTVRMNSCSNSSETWNSWQILSRSESFVACKHFKII